MRQKQTKPLSDYVIPLSMNGLNGRMFRLPPKTPQRTREILLVYGHHASLERMFGLAEELNKYGAVTVPDLPGFGGMESFYKIGEKPTIDNFADYLAAFVKLRYKRKKIAVIAMSFGFVIATRMLQKYPELTKKVELLVSGVGFVHKEDLKVSKSKLRAYKVAAHLCMIRPIAFFARTCVMRTPVLKATYIHGAERSDKLRGAAKEEQLRRIMFEIGLWQNNDVRTRASTLLQIFNLNLCNNRVDLPVFHVAVDRDRYFDNHVIEQHLKVIYSSCEILKSPLPNHAPTVVATAKEAAPFIPTKIRRLLAKKRA